MQPGLEVVRADDGEDNLPRTRKMRGMRPELGVSRRRSTRVEKDTYYDGNVASDNAGDQKSVKL